MGRGTFVSCGSMFVCKKIESIRKDGTIMKTLDWIVMQKGAREIVQTGLVLYGASSTGDRMVNYLRDMGISDKIVAVIDSDEKKWGERWNGYEVYSPKKLEDIENNITIVITSVFVKEISEWAGI